MSHIVQIETQIRDSEAVRAACCRLGLPPPVFGTARLFSGSATGLQVQLPQWRYPVVCELETGKLHYDNYNGAWGNSRQLDLLRQAYAAEKAKIEARKRGHTVLEQPLADGSIKLTIQLGGGVS